MMHSHKFSFFGLLLGLLLCSFSAQAAPSHADVANDASAVSDSTQHFSDVMDQFNEDKALAAERAISDTSKHQVLFWMGAALLLLILLAAGFGIAMGIFDKDVFVWHVLSAGLATTLAVAHGVTAFVWFFPGSLF